MAFYDLYGFSSLDIQGAKQLLEKALDLEFQAHESAYQGGIYFQHGNANEEHLVLKQNLDPYDGEAAELSFSKYPVLFYVNDTARSEDFQQRIMASLPALALLRHERL
jgi:hypothetical protein